MAQNANFWSKRPITIIFSSNAIRMTWLRDWDRFGDRIGFNHFFSNAIRTTWLRDLDRFGEVWHGLVGWKWPKMPTFDPNVRFRSFFPRHHNNLRGWDWDRSALYQLFINSSSALHQLFISSSSTLHQLFISSLSTLHQLFISSSSTLHQFFIDSSAILHSLFISSSSALYQLFISSSSV